MYTYYPLFTLVLMYPELFPLRNLKNRPVLYMAWLVMKYMDVLIFPKRPVIHIAFGTLYYTKDAALEQFFKIFSCFSDMFYSKSYTLNI